MNLRPYYTRFKVSFSVQGESSILCRRRINEPTITYLILNLNSSQICPMVLINPRGTCVLVPPPYYKGVGLTSPPLSPTILPYFERFLPFTDSLLCRLQDDGNIIGYICKWCCWGQRRHPTWPKYSTFFTYPLFFCLACQKNSTYRT